MEDIDERTALLSERGQEPANIQEKQRQGVENAQHLVVPCILILNKNSVNLKNNGNMVCSVISNN